MTPDPLTEEARGVSVQEHDIHVRAMGGLEAEKKAESDLIEGHQSSLCRRVPRITPTR